MKFLNVLLMAAVGLPALPVVAEIDMAPLWRQNCQRCHAADGSAQNAMGRRLQIRDYRDAEVQAAMTDEEIITATTDGVTKDGKEVMPAYKDKLTEEQIAGFVAYIRAMKKD